MEAAEANVAWREKETLVPWEVEQVEPSGYDTDRDSSVVVVELGW